MTGKERLKRTCLGMEVDRIPWAPMLYQWFNINKYRNKLPEKLNNCKTTLDAMLVMEAGLFAKHEAFIVSAGYSHIRRCLFYQNGR